VIRRSAIVLFLLCSAFAHCAAAQGSSSSILTCTDPTPLDSAWWHWTWRPNANGSSSGTVPEAPHQRRGLDPSTWTGTYRLWLVHTVGPDRGDTVTAAVELRYERASARSKAIVRGTAAATRPWPGYFSFAPTSAIGDSLRRPVEVDYDPDVGRLSFVLGNPGLTWTDSGVILDVFTMTNDGFVGRWVDGGLIVFGDSTHTEEVHPQGYFCLARVGS
jgi:hypothetical protein